MPKTIFDSGYSAAAMRERNPDNFDPGIQNLRYRVDETIYIYSCAKRPFTVSQTLFPRLELRGCTDGERFCLAATLSDPVPQSSPDLERGGARVDLHDGWKVAIGLLNPLNNTNDPWMETAPGLSVGTNLMERGLWPSTSKEPKEAEVLRAEAFRDKRYKRITGQAIRLGATNRKGLEDYLAENEDVHEAMDALGLQADWHRVNVVTRPCPNCGDSISPSLAFHRSSVTGEICMVDPARAEAAMGKAKFKQLTAV